MRGKHDDYATRNFDEAWDYGSYWEPVVLDLDGGGFDERTAWVGLHDSAIAATRCRKTPQPTQYPHAA